MSTPTPTTACSTCGTDSVAGARYCHMCGASLTGSTTGNRDTIERRVVSVLFADLEGFTAFSADRDPEDVREMLSQYFEVCRRVITRHGGLVEKFIGDAVMAVWGTPIAREGDPIEAVKAALELVATVSDLEVEPGVFLRIRGGVVTGEAAVTLGTVGQGMVAGDVVNTASRLQSNAPAGRVFVDDDTHELTESAIVYTDAGDFELKGKPEPVHVWQAETVTTASHGIEAPFLGRDDELATVNAAYRATVDRRTTESVGGRSRLVAVMGGSGVGKSRLAREFIRGVETSNADVAVATGVSAEFGQVGSFGAVTQILSALLSVAPDDPADTVAERIRDALSVRLESHEEIDWTVQRVLALLRPTPGVAFERGELFHSWRVLIHSFSDVRSLILVFEELQWAEAGVAEFLSDLIDLSPKEPIFVLVLARPGIDVPASAETIAEGRAVGVELAPLANDTIIELVGTLVPDLNPRLRREIATQAEGVPLYAVETLRMLANQGILAREENSYRTVGVVDRLEIPRTVNLMVGVRLDALAAASRDVAQTAAILGMRFPVAHLALLTDVAVEQLMPRIRDLVEEEVFEYHADAAGGPTCIFVQGLVREVAYGRLSKRDRIRQHLKAARLLDSEAPEVVASHYLAAYNIEPTNAEALEGARRTLGAAAANSAAVGAADSAQRFYLVALEMADDDPGVRKDLAFQAGEMANLLGEWTASRELFTTARAYAEQVGDVAMVANCYAQIARVAGNNGDATDALEVMREAHAMVTPETPPEVEGVVVRRRADYEFISGHPDTAYQLAERACEIYAGLDDPARMAEAMHTRAWPLASLGRLDEALAHVAAARALAASSGNLFAEWEAMYREGWICSEYGMVDQLRDVARSSRPVADRMGERSNDGLFGAFLVRALYFRGEWDEAITIANSYADRSDIVDADVAPFRYLAFIYSHRGNEAEATRMLSMVPEGADPSDLDCYRHPIAHATVALDRGDAAHALELSRPFLTTHHRAGGPQQFEEAFVAATAAAALLRDATALAEFIALADSELPGRKTPSLRGQTHLARARRAILADDVEAAAAAFRDAMSALRRSGHRYDLAVAIGEYALWAREHGVPSAQEAEEAAALFESLGATPWLTRLRAQSASAAR